MGIFGGRPEISAVCRMIVAAGSFDPQKIVGAAVQMGRGVGTDHERPVPCHPNGWGIIKAMSPGGTLDIRKGAEPLWDVVEEQRSWLGSPHILSVHVRHATRPTTLGLDYCHPVSESHGDGWHMMHNGYLPTIHEQLNLKSSQFDSREYLAWVLSTGFFDRAANDRVRMLDELSPGGSSANAIFIREGRVQVFVWHPEDSRLQKYFTMHMLLREEAIIIASEPVPNIAERSEWTPLTRGSLIDIDASQEALRIQYDIRQSRRIK